MTIWLLAVTLEIAGLMAAAAGIGIELAMGADIGFVLITAGATGVALGSLIFA